MSSPPPTHLQELPTVDLSLTAGRPIKCAGWVCQKGNTTWSGRNVVFVDDLVIPVPGPRQVRVRVYAAGVNPADVQRTSILGANTDGRHSRSKRGARPSAQFEYPWACGIEGAGVVESVGWDAEDPESTEFGLARGDRVMFLADITKGTGGSFSQYAIVDADVAVKLIGPSNSLDDRMIDFVEAATLPAAAQTAYVALFDKLRVEPGRSIFISGASGGVGTVAVQLAHHFGLYVFASCSTPNLAFVEKLGADVVLDYTTTDVVGEILKRTDGHGVDYVLENASASLSEDHAAAARFGGAICILTGQMTPTTDLAFRQQLSIHYIFLGMFLSNPLGRLQLRPLGHSVQRLYLQGAFDVFVEEVPLERAREAMDVVSKGHTRGKIVLTCFHPGEAATEEQRRRRLKVQWERNSRASVVSATSKDP